MISGDVLLTGLVVGLIAGVAQAVGSWLAVKYILKRLDAQAKVVVEGAELTSDQKSKLLVGLTASASGFFKEYLITVKDIMFWWRKR
jgi:hypothetical protein